MNIFSITDILYIYFIYMSIEKLKKVKIMKTSYEQIVLKCINMILIKKEAYYASSK